MVSRYDRTFIGIDYGKKRIGLSKSDPSGSIASPLTTLEVSSDKEALSAVLGFINQYSPDGLVVGYPLHESGDITEKCKEVDAFIEELARLYAGPIHRTDERYSTQEAADIVHAHGKKIGRYRKRLDRLAAVIILQRFLDEQLDRTENGGLS